MKKLTAGALALMFAMGAGSALASNHKTLVCHLSSGENPGTLIEVSNSNGNGDKLSTLEKHTTSSDRHPWVDCQEGDVQGVDGALYTFTDNGDGTCTCDT